MLTNDKTTLGCSTQYYPEELNLQASNSRSISYTSCRVKFSIAGNQYKKILEEVLHGSHLRGDTTLVNGQPKERIRRIGSSHARASLRRYRSLVESDSATDKSKMFRDKFKLSSHPFHSRFLKSSIIYF